MIIRDKYLNRINKFIDKPVIKVITGMRRVGKSYFIRQISDKLALAGIKSDQILSINMELVMFDFIKNYSDLHSYVTNYFNNASYKKYLFIDEIQEINQWEKAIVSFFAEGQYDIYISGSNSNLLSSELSTLISGRFVELNIYSLSFNEFLDFRGNEKQDINTEFQNYIKFGGFPVIHSFGLNQEVTYQYISSLYSTILLKDIISRYEIRNINLFQDIVRFAFTNIGNIFTSNSINQYLKNQKLNVGVDTIQNYLYYLETSFLLHKVRRYDIKGKRILELYEKYYLGDISLKNAITGFKDDDISGILENLIFLKLKQDGFNVFVGKLDEYEIDFIAEKSGKRKYIQVCYLLDNDKTIEREFSALEKIKDNYPKYVVTMDNMPQSDRNGIKRIHITDFLMDNIQSE
jgi:predicted AAA+ superfamily ATPase